MFEFDANCERKLIMLRRRGDIYMFFAQDYIVIVIAHPGGRAGFAIPSWSRPCARTCVLSTIVS